VNLLFYGVFLCSVFVSLLELSPIRGIIPFGTSRIAEIDILMIALVGVWLADAAVRCTSGRRVYQTGELAAYVLVGVLLVPAFVGLASGKSVGVVLRDCRTPLFFLAVLPMTRIMGSWRGLERFLAVLKWVAGIAVITGLGLWLSSREAPMSGSYRFGISSAMPIVAWVMLLSVAAVMMKRPLQQLRRGAWCFIVAGLLFVFFANDIRSVYVGMLAGLAALSCGVIFRGRRLHLRRWTRPLLAFVVCLGLVSGAGAAIIVKYSPDILSVALKDMRVHRIYSLLDPTFGGTVYVGEGGGNREDRLLGLTYGLELGRRNAGFGVGYGDNALVALDDVMIARLVQRNRLEGSPGNTVENLLLTHNSYGWAFGRLGIWAGTAYFVLVLLLCLRAWRAAKSTDSDGLRSVLLGTLATVVYMLVVGFGGGSFFDYTGQGLIPWLACLSVLVGGGRLASRRVRAGDESAAHRTEGGQPVGVG
jgi:hypothetical protein